MWTLEKRKMLKAILAEGYQIKDIAAIMNISKMTLYAELKKGLTPSEYLDRRYVLYEPARAIEEDIKLRVGVLELKYYIDWVERK